MTKRIALLLALLLTLTALPAFAVELNDDGDYAKLVWFFNESGIQVPPDCYIMQKIREDLNIELIHHAPQGTDYEERLMVLIASDETPDIIGTYSTLTTKLIADNIIIPIEDYLTPERLPNYFRISRNVEAEIEDLRFPNGHVYTIPSILSNNLDSGPWIRTDWLDKLGLDMPTTMEELSDVLIAFAQGDMNGDGTTTYATMSNEFWGLSSFFEALGCTTAWYIGEDGLPELGTLSNRMPEALKYIKNLIDNGALNADLVTVKYDQISEKVDAGLVGYLYGWQGNGSRTAMREIYPDAEWKPMFPAKGVYDKGYIGCTETNNVRDEYAISATCSDIDAVFRLFDYMCQDTSDENGMTYEGGYWLYLGEPGVNWGVVDGKVVMDGEYADQNQVDRWAGWPARRFQNQYDIRWAGANDYDIETTKFRLTIPTGNDIPADHPLKPLEFVVIDDNVINNFHSEWTITKFPEQLCYNAILGKGDIDELYAQFLENANAAGYQEVRARIAEYIED